MFLSRLKLDHRNPQVLRDLRDVNAMHQRVMRAFPQKVSAVNPRESLGILYRLDKSREGQLTLLVQSSAPPDWTSLPAGYLTLPQPFDDAVPNPALRVLDESLANLAGGQRLRFRLRANPTKKVDTKTGPDGKKKNGRRIALTNSEDRIAWLERKGEQHGFKLVDVEFSTGRSSAVLDLTEGRATGNRLSPDGKPASGLTFGSVVFEGLLEVSERGLFVEALKHGIGSGKAFGFGLLSIAPAE